MDTRKEFRELISVEKAHEIIRGLALVRLTFAIGLMTYDKKGHIFKIH